MSAVWVLDDDKSIRWVFEKALEKANLPFKIFSNTNEAINQFNHDKPSVIVSDIRMPGESGLSFLAKVKDKFPEIPIIIMTAYSDLDTAVASFQKGAFEYIAKPFDINHVINIIEKALEKNMNIDSHEAEQFNPKNYPDIIGQAPAMQEVFRMIGKLGETTATVLINGESGSGKELVANAIHKNSKQRNGPFIAINTAAIPNELLEAELFGHEKGAFTGANQLKKGRFEQANEGTLFLDEIGDMPVDLQTRLLRVLNDGYFYRIGGQDQIKANVRVITATHQNLEKLVKEGKFREDLFHRLNVIRIKTPSLRDRAEDIPMLCNFFLKRSASQLNVSSKIISQDALEFFKNLNWQGNVRQLENTCHWLTVMTSGKIINISDLPDEIKNETTLFTLDNFASWEGGLKKVVFNAIVKGEENIYSNFINEAEKIIIQQALKKTNNRKIDAAKILGIGRNTITRKIKELSIK
jgi:two-component system nitrogen regulation response regulator GlnG